MPLLHFKQMNLIARSQVGLNAQPFWTIPSGSQLRRVDTNSVRTLVPRFLGALFEMQHLNLMEKWSWKHGRSLTPCLPLPTDQISVQDALEASIVMADRF